MLEQELTALGFSDKERRVYSTLIEVGKATPARLAAQTGIRRPTVYSVLDDLVARGYVVVDSTKKILLYSPTPPDELGKIVKRARYELSKQEELVETLAQSLKSLPGSRTYSVPKLKFIEGTDEVEKYLYAQTPTWFKSAHAYDGACLGFQDDSFVAHEPYRSWIRWCTERADHVDTRLLSNNTDTEKEMGSKKLRDRTIKFWGNVADFSATQWIMGDYSVLLMTREKPHYLVEMHDAVYTSNMRKFFLGVFNSLP